MKAFQFNTDYVLDIIDCPSPEPSKDRVLVKVDKCGICGSDISMYKHGSTADHGIIPGHEFTGVVTDPGPRSDLKLGDRVLSNCMYPCDHCLACKTGHPNCCRHNNTHGLGLSVPTPGGMAEFVACVPERVYRLPDHIDFTLGTLTDPIAVALHALYVANVQIGRSVLITGAGPIGLCVAILCKLAGASLIVMTEASDDKLASIPPIFPEIDHMLDAKDPGMIPKLLELTGGVGFDCAIECCGVGPAVEACIYGTKVAGNIALTGLSIDNISIPSVYVMINELHLQGTMCYLDSEFEIALELLSNPAHDFRRVITKVVSMEDTPAAYAGLLDHSWPDYKVVVDIAGGL